MMRLIPLAPTLQYLSFSDIDSPDISLPDISLPDISLPNVDLPNVDFPNVDFPNMDFPNISLPDISLSDSLSNLAEIASQLQSVVSAAIAHPLWAIALFLLSITLIQIIADLTRRLIQAALSGILKLPLALSRWIWQRATKPSDPDAGAQMHQLIIKIERLHEEQNHAIAQLKTLLANQPLLNSQSSPAELLSPEASGQTQETSADQPAATEARKSSSTVLPDVG